MIITIDDGLIGEIVAKLSTEYERQGLTEGIPESMVSTAVEAGVREHLAKVAYDEAIDLSIQTKASTDRADRLIEAKLRALRQFNKEPLPAVTEQRPKPNHPALL